eukprot:353284-Chlamydomonas_euryale.AAC.10
MARSAGQLGVMSAVVCKLLLPCNTAAAAGALSHGGDGRGGPLVDASMGGNTGKAVELVH